MFLKLFNCMSRVSKCTHCTFSKPCTIMSAEFLTGGVKKKTVEADDTMALQNIAVYFIIAVADLFLLLVNFSFPSFRTS